ncbi:hypothetical protein D7V86_19680 [bacterium D16-51]|nr:hypothetical protein D7V96_03510 [bacterium D16-59]RKI56312.1 hypothetical protein D7V86_19680 [bacterium D16-51]
MICRKLEECINGELQSNSLEKCDNKNRMNCIKSSDRRSAVKCEENKKKYVFENTKKNHVILYKMDGGIIKEDKFVPSNTSKCDYLFVISDAAPTAVLAELKGVDVSKALIQLKGTLLLYRNIFCKFGRVYARAIVTSSTPNLKASPEYVNLERMIRKDYKGNIKIVERQFNEKDIEL